MNIMYLRYAVEVEKTHSINKAAENLYMGQPNLSRAIKDLEESLGITIFDRTPRGMKVTADGEEFLQHAKRILKQIDEVDQLYQSGKNGKQTLSVSVPRAEYISRAFARFAATADPEKPVELFYKETNSMRAINNILHADYKLGIIRYSSVYDKYFKDMLQEKGLTWELIAEFRQVLLMSDKHPLAGKETISLKDLSGYTEIAYSDPFVPSLSASAVKKEELPDSISKRIFVFERASQIDLLTLTPGTFLWSEPVTDEFLARNGLIRRTCEDNRKVYKDLFIYKKDYHLSALDDRFISEVCKTKREYQL